MLTPMMETVDLEGSLQVPIRIMKSMQTAVQIVVDPVPTTLCKYVVTDEHWLHENILAMLR